MTACSSAGYEAPKLSSAEKSMKQQVISVGIQLATPEQPGSELIFQAVNNSTEEIQLLIWSTPFENQLSADIFQVTIAGEEKLYLGRMIKRGSSTESDYVSIAANGLMEVRFDIADYYDLSEAGVYTVELDLPVINKVTQLNQETPVNLLNDQVQITIE